MGLGLVGLALLLLLCCSLEVETQCCQQSWKKTAFLLAVTGGHGSTFRKYGLKLLKECLLKMAASKHLTPLSHAGVELCILLASSPLADLDLHLSSITGLCVQMSLCQEERGRAWP